VNTCDSETQAETTTLAFAPVLVQTHSPNTRFCSFVPFCFVALRRSGGGGGSVVTEELTTYFVKVIELKEVVEHETKVRLRRA